MTVSDLTRKIRSLLEVEVGAVEVEGEVSNHRRQQSGHHYFTLKDDKAQLSCVLFRGDAMRLGRGLRLGDGQAVVCAGEISVYEARGAYQLIVRRVHAAGVGALQARFEALKEKLRAEGLFDATAKQPLPAFPRHVGLVTSPSGAALQDFLQVIERRAPWLQLHLAGVPVQGEGAAAKIAAAVEELGRRSGADLPSLDALVLCRGGGSLEDLWSFNEECLARAIHACPVPIVSAVGHETDFTIADFVADLRAPTPSAAAELLSPSRDELQRRLEQTRARLSGPLERRLGHARQLLVRSGPERLTRLVLRRLEAGAQDLDRSGSALESAATTSLAERRRELGVLAGRLAATRPERQLGRRRRELEKLAANFARLAPAKLRGRRAELKRLKGLLRALSPGQTLERGYSLTLREDGSLLRHVADAPSGTRLRTRLSDGEVESEVQ